MNGLYSCLVVMLCLMSGLVVSVMFWLVMVVLIVSDVWLKCSFLCGLMLIGLGIVVRNLGYRLCVLCSSIWLVSVCGEVGVVSIDGLYIVYMLSGNSVWVVRCLLNGGLL